MPLVQPVREVKARRFFAAYYVTIVNAYFFRGIPDEANKQARRTKRFKEAKSVECIEM